MKLYHEAPSSVSPPVDDVLVALAVETFREVLPGLLEEGAENMWFGYHGSRQIGRAGTKREAIQLCRDQGIPDNESVALCAVETTTQVEIRDDYFDRR